MTTQYAAEVVSINAARSHKSPISPTLLLSTVMRLISHYGSQANSSPQSAAMIEQYLISLATLPDQEPVLRTTYQQLAEHWGMVLERSAVPHAAFST